MTYKQSCEIQEISNGSVVGNICSTFAIVMTFVAIFQNWYLTQKHNCHFSLNSWCERALHLMLLELISFSWKLTVFSVTLPDTIVFLALDVDNSLGGLLQVLGDYFTTHVTVFPLQVSRSIEVCGWKHTL